MAMAAGLFGALLKVTLVGLVADAAPEPASTSPGAAAPENPSASGDAVAPENPSPSATQTTPKASSRSGADAGRQPPPPRADVPASPRHKPPPSTVIGGYWDLDRLRGPEPKDGAEQILAGAILVPLGFLATTSGATLVYLSPAQHCEARWSQLGRTPDADQCRGLYAYGWVRTAYGALMLGSGAALLGIGLHRRRVHQRWERGLVARPVGIERARVGVLFVVGGAGLSFSLRI